MTDVRMFQLSADGGEIEVSGGIVAMNDGLETAAYLSLFGGNEDDDGTDATKALEWWGNKLETDEERKFRSRFQALVDGLPATSGNLALLRDAAAADLAWMVDAGLADAIDIGMSIPALHRLRVALEFQVSGKTYRFSFETAWTS